MIVFGLHSFMRPVIYCCMGKKIFFLKIDYSEKDKQKEKDADNFAIKWTLSQDEEDQILELFKITAEDVLEFAAKFNTHPAIIIGRLQHKGLVPYSLGRQFFEPIELE